MLCCDNKCALELSSHHIRRIRPSAKCADIRHSLKTTKPLLNGTFQYVHIYRHMDQYLKWEQLMMTQQLNCVCKALAKKSITTAIIHGYHDRQSQLLPKEDVALVIWGTKFTGNILPPLRFHASKEVARKYLATRKKDKYSKKAFQCGGLGTLGPCSQEQGGYVQDVAVQATFGFLQYEGSGRPLLQ